MRTVLCAEVQTEKLKRWDELSRSSYFLIMHCLSSVNTSFQNQILETEFLWMKAQQVLFIGVLSAVNSSALFFSQALSWPLVRPEEGHHTTSLTSSQVTHWVAIRVLLVIAGYLPYLHQQIKSEVNLAMPVGLQVLPSRRWWFCFCGIICFVIVNFMFWTDCLLPPTLIFFI